MAQAVDVRMGTVFSLSCRLTVLAGLTGAIAGCHSRPVTPAHSALSYTQELPPGEKALRKILPDRYPRFTSSLASQGRLLRSIDNSLLYLSKPSSEKFFPYLDITHERAVATLRAMREIISSADGRPVPWDQEILEKFDVYQSVGAPNPDGWSFSQQVLFTGYFTPTYDASLARGGNYQWPLYKRPADLLSDEAGGASRRDSDGNLLPYSTRQQIESGHDPACVGHELVWLASRWQAYVITVQGSGRLRLRDGRIFEVGYAGTNGHPYVSPGKQMLADGVIARDQLSLAGLGRYFDTHPEAVDRYLWLNPRTTFFAERPGGPFGKLNVPVTERATLATDKEVYPRAMPAYVVTGTPGVTGVDPQGVREFMLDQDAGGAIRAAGRCDLYMGVGDAAERSAGELLATGQLYYLALKPEFVARYSRTNQP